MAISGGSVVNLPGIVYSVHNSFPHYFLPNRHGLRTPNPRGLLTPNRHGLLTPNRQGLLTPNRQGLLTSNRQGLLTPNRQGLLTSNRHSLLTPLPSQTRNSLHSLDTVSASLSDGIAASSNLYGSHSTIGLLTLQISADF
jgi:hypothetical protein